MNKMKLYLLLFSFLLLNNNLKSYCTIDNKNKSINVIIEEKHNILIIKGKDTISNINDLFNLSPNYEIQFKLPFKEVVDELLKCQGFDVYYSDTIESNYTFKIKATGTATYPESNKGEDYRVSNALGSITGNIVFYSKDSMIFIDNYSTEYRKNLFINRNDIVKDIIAQDLSSDFTILYKNSPFNSIWHAFYSEDGFVGCFIDMCYSLFGLESLVCGIKSDNDEIIECVEEFIDTLKILESESQRNLVKMLSDDDIRIKKSAIKLLGNTKDSKYVQNLIFAANDTNEVIRGASIDALGNINNPLAIKYLVSNLEENSTLAINSIKSLGKTKDTTAINPLIRLLTTTDNYEIKGEIALTLANIGNSRVNEHLLNIVLNRKNILRVAKSKNDYGSAEKMILNTSKALGILKEEKAITSLIEMLKEDKYGTLIPVCGGVYKEHYPFKETAHEALKSITGENLNNDYKTWKNWYSGK